MNTEQVCEVCGEPATEEVWDLQEDTKYGAPERHFKRIEPSHKFCATHRREPIRTTYDD
jgi:hypothetical protein